MWKEIFKIGKHIDANGNEREWTIEDLDIIVSKYNNQEPDNRHEAPVVIGHPVNNSPAYAWIESLKRVDDVLLAKFTQIDPEFKKLIQEGRYKKVSMALYPDMLLRHVGFLGAIPPAIKGLKDTKFNEDKSFIYFEEFKIDTNQITEQTLINIQGGDIMSEQYQKIFEELLKWIASTFNEEIANQIAEEFERIKNKYLNDSEPETKSDVTEETDVSDTKQNKEFQEMQRKIEMLENDNWNMKFNEYFKSQLGRLVPSQKSIVKLAFDAVRNNKGFEFSENGKTITISGEDLIKKLIESFPMQVEFNEFAKQNSYNDNDLESQNKFIDEYYKRRQ